MPIENALNKDKDEKDKQTQSADKLESPSKKIK